MALFLANREHPSYGVLRAIVTDANDTSEVLTYLDSDGRLNSNMGSRKPKQGAPAASRGTGVALAARLLCWRRCGRLTPVLRACCALQL